MFKKKKYVEKPLYNLDFYNAIEYVKIATKSVKTTSEKIDIIDFVINVVKTDLQSDLLSAMFYKGWDLKRIGYPFPFNCYNEKGEEIKIYDDSEALVQVDLQKQCVIALPWKKPRYTSAILNMKKLNFEYMSDNHFSSYYTYADLCYVFNGVHSISASLAYNKKGIIMWRVLHTELLFPHVYSDGEYWYNSHTTEPIKKVWDFRTAIIYELCKMKYNLENKNNNTN